MTTWWWLATALAAGEGTRSVLRKPFTEEALLNVIRSALEFPR
jgi:hypothetical protein